MAITKLLHMKESPTYPSNHLKDTIDYILDVKNDGKKTEYGLWTGGNAGTDASEVYQKFMETKKAWGKIYGRQGYHFVISFAPGETDEATCYEVLIKFCERYLGDNYEYVFAVHNDKDHIHGHIVFNSVSRTTGYKYRYEKGDWEKYIQPITDEITKEHGLSPLVYSEERKGKGYAEWINEKTGRFDKKAMVRADVELAIKHASNMEEFFLLMRDMGYEVEPGRHTKEDGSIISILKFKFTFEDGTVYKRRSHKLSSNEDEYSLANIKARIENKSNNQTYYYETAALLLERKMFLRLGSATKLYGFQTFGRLYQAVSYYKLPNPFAVPPYQVRSDIARIDRLIDECIYIKTHPYNSMAELKVRKENIDEKLKALYIKRKELRSIKESFGLLIPKEVADEYIRRKKQLSEIKKEDDAWEQIEDELFELEENLPSAFVSNADDLIECEGKIKLLKNENRILERVLEMESESEPSMNIPYHVTEFENNKTKKRSETL